MKLEGRQVAAYDTIMTSQEPLVVLTGNAGTGKSTVLAEAAASGEFDILTPTHKAADVLRKKGVSSPRTYHSVLYAAQEEIKYVLPDGTVEEVWELEDVPEEGKILSRTPWFGKRAVTGQAKVKALVDEASMVREKELDDLMGAYQQVVLVGDPFQLPPVKARDLFSELDVDIHLDEVHRVAKGNPITAYANAIRRGEDPKPDGKIIVPLDQKNPDLYKWLTARDVQSVVWTNNLRHHVNQRFRETLGRERGTVEAGEPLVCLSNIRKSLDGEKVYQILYNGQLVTAATPPATGKGPYLPQGLNLDETADGIRVWPFWDSGHWAARALKGRDGWEEKVRRLGRAYEFDYPYALTAHKAQGSEWDRVAVWDQRPQMKRCMSREGVARWYYTATTRAAERLLLIAA